MKLFLAHFLAPKSKMGKMLSLKSLRCMVGGDGLEPPTLSV
jgi:hypothetical protein